MQRLLPPGVICLLVACIALLSGCISGTYTKPNNLSFFKKIELDYPLVYQSEENTANKFNFLRNGQVIAVSNPSHITFVNLGNGRVIKEIRSNALIGDIDGKAVNKDGSRYLWVKDRMVNVMDTSNWRLISQFKGGWSDFAGLSPDGKTAFVSRTDLWDVDSQEKIVSLTDSVGWYMAYEFSEDSRYFIGAPGRGDLFILYDIESRQRINILTPLRYPDKARFGPENSFYLDSYDKYGPTTRLAWFSIEPHKKLAEIRPYKPISCWTRLDNNTLIMGLMDGDVLLLNKELEVMRHWSIGSEATLCTAGKKGLAWLGTKSGVFRLDTENNTLANPVKSVEVMRKLVVSPNGKYIGFVGYDSGIFVKVHLIQ
ncbi:WD40 repeat domain-containing protein [Motiliproteus sp. MSK22-1]|uniref:WD40 repeat domain-containing protein n=1 Tax=Motiliproteus sp. MSK22-1 TaxID=1897630 RepID=UPI000977EF16|nr:WD40 repeat domain-containing protein [Motiliproteus sp. MSK22-1]OMH28015.1 hypothetical protein BGP75_21835 [Motiliproteus sp. MSK22-1]